MASKKSKRDGTRNLIPLNRRTKEEQKEIVFKGGKRSGEVRRAKRDFKNRVLELLNSPCAMKELKEQLGEKMGIKVDENIDAMIAIAFKGALEGDTKKMELLAKWAGLDQPQKIDINAEVTQRNVIVVNGKEFRID